MTVVLILAGDTVSVRSIEMSLQVERFDVKRVTNSDQLFKAFAKADRVGVLLDLSAPWSALSALVRRLRAHAAGRSLRVLLFGALPPDVSPAGLQTLGIAEDDLFPEPVDMPKLVKRLRDLPAPTPGREGAKHVARSPLGFPVHGTLAKGALARVLMAVETGKGTGQLEVTSGQTVACLSFKEGLLISAKCATGPLALGALLLQKGAVSPEELASLSERGPINLETLVSGGVVSPHEILDVAKEHAAAIIGWALTSGTGGYRWHEGASPKSGGFPMGIKMSRAIIDAMQADASHVLPGDIAGSTIAVDPVVEQCLRSEGLHPLELRAINMMNRKQPAQKIVDALGSGNEVRAREVAGFIRALLLMCPREDASRQEPAIDWESKKVELEKVLKQMEGGSPFDVLGVTPETSLADVRTRFFSLSKEYHPDRYHAAGQELVDLAKEIFTRVQEAYDIVGDPQKREAFRKKEEDGEGGLNPRALIAAEIAFSKAALFLKNRHYAKAKESLEEAVRLNPHEPEYTCYLAWVTFLEDPSTYVQAARTLNATLKEYPHIDKGFYFLGRILKSRNEMSQAAGAFKRAVAANPDNVEAKRELRLMEMRKEKQGGKHGSSRKGFLARFRRY